MNKQDTLKAAAIELHLHIMEEGAEFPDEAYRIAQKYKVKQSDLEQAYDKLTS